MRKGLYANIHAKRKRGEKMRKKGAKGAPTAKAFARAMQNILPAASSTRSNLMESFPVSMSVAKNSFAVFSTLLLEESQDTLLPFAAFTLFDDWSQFCMAFG